MEAAVINIGGYEVGEERPPLFLAELGTFFNDDPDLARAYIKQAVEAGVRVIKTEVLHDPNVCLADTGLIHHYTHAAGEAAEDYRALMERKVISLDGYRRIFGLCRELEVPFVASVYDLVGVDFLVEVGAAGIKISRDKIDNPPLIRHAAATGLPIIIDAGEVPLEETVRAVRWAREAGAGGVMVNHHPGSEPAPPRNHNLRVIETLKRTLGVPVGLSCHYRGELMMYLAAAMGADLIEKGVARDPEVKEQAIIAASPLSLLPEILANIQAAWQARGDGIPQVAVTKEHSSRQCLVTSRAVAKGERFSLDNLHFAFPPKGISTVHWDRVDGARAARDLPAQSPLYWPDVDLPGRDAE